MRPSSITSTYNSIHQSINPHLNLQPIHHLVHNNPLTMPVICTKCGYKDSQTEFDYFFSKEKVDKSTLSHWVIDNRVDFDNTCAWPLTYTITALTLAKITPAARRRISSIRSMTNELAT